MEIDILVILKKAKSQVLALIMLTRMLRPREHGARDNFYTNQVQ